MLARPQIEVLRGYRPFARTLAVYNPENYGPNNDQRLVTRNLLEAIGSTILCISLVILSSLSLYICLAVAEDLLERIYQLTLILVQMQQVLIYISMSRKNRQILDALAQLQKIVNNRKNLTFSSSNSHNNFLLNSVGCTKSYAHYELVEQQYSSYLVKVIKVLICLIASNNVLLLPQVILYAIFGQPEPAEWGLPNGLR